MHVLWNAFLLQHIAYIFCYSHRTCRNTHYYGPDSRSFQATKTTLGWCIWKANTTTLLCWHLCSCSGTDRERDQWSQHLWRKVPLLLLRTGIWLVMIPQVNHCDVMTWRHFLYHWSVGNLSYLQMLSISDCVDVNLNKIWDKQCSSRWIETSWCLRDVTVMNIMTIWLKCVNGILQNYRGFNVLALDRRYFGN